MSKKQRLFTPKSEQPLIFMQLSAPSKHGVYDKSRDDRGGVHDAHYRKVFFVPAVGAEKYQQAYARACAKVG